MSVVTLITSKQAKAREAGAILEHRIEHRSYEGLVEIQSLNLREVVEAKARAAFARHGGPVLVEDVSLIVHALGGFPGTFVRFWQEGPGYAHAVRIAAVLDDYEATAVCGVGYFDGERFFYAEGSVHGRLVPARGQNSTFGFDPYFEPEGTHMTFAEMTFQEKNSCSHRYHGYVAMREILRKEGIF